MHHVRLWNPVGWWHPIGFTLAVMATTAIVVAAANDQGQQVVSGVYFVRMQSGARIQTRKIVYLR